MKRPNIRLLLLLCLLFTITIFIFYNNSTSPLAEESNQNEITEANEILEKIHETKLAFQIEEALKKNGYSPYGGIGYQIYSSDKQYVIIPMENIDPKNNEIKKDIQKIVNTVSKANGFNLFVIDIQKVEK